MRLNIIQRRLGHANLGIYLQGVYPEEIITAVHAAGADDAHQRRPPALSDR